MTNADTGDLMPGKPWYTSKTIWGGIVSAFAPLIGLALHVTVSPELAEAIAGTLASAGGAVAIIGRVSANQPIATKAVAK